MLLSRSAEDPAPSATALVTPGATSLLAPSAMLPFASGNTMLFQPSATLCTPPVADSPPNARLSVPSATDSPPRSEEHTSELQSLMRISYAVFCLKKKH